jgi:hypothetical protein
MKSAVLYWFGLRDAGILYLRAVIQRTVDVSPEFLEHGSAEKIAACRYANRGLNKQEDCIEAFLHKAAQNFEIYSNIQDQK